MEQIDDGALVPVSDVKRKIHHSPPTTIVTALPRYMLNNACGLTACYFPKNRRGRFRVAHASTL